MDKIDRKLMIDGNTVFLITAHSQHYPREFLWIDYYAFYWKKVPRPKSSWNRLARCLIFSQTLLARDHNIMYLLTDI